MSTLNPTPLARLLDARGRPYFLWDVDVDLDTFKRNLCDPDREVAVYWTSKLMRQAKPDDVFTFVSLARLGELWPVLEPTLGKTRAFWTWLLQAWGVIDDS